MEPHSTPPPPQPKEILNSFYLGSPNEQFLLPFTEFGQAHAIDV